MVPSCVPLLGPASRRQLEQHDSLLLPSPNQAGFINREQTVSSFLLREADLAREVIRVDQESRIPAMSTRMFLSVFGKGVTFSPLLLSIVFLVIRS